MFRNLGDESRLCRLARVNSPIRCALARACRIAILKRGLKVLPGRTIGFISQMSRGTDRSCDSSSQGQQSIRKIGDLSEEGRGETCPPSSSHLALEFCLRRRTAAREDSITPDLEAIIDGLSKRGLAKMPERASVA